MKNEELGDGTDGSALGKVLQLAINQSLTHQSVAFHSCCYNRKLFCIKALRITVNHLNSNSLTINHLQAGLQKRLSIQISVSHYQSTYYAKTVKTSKIPVR
jgi:hypothetical protein